MDSSSQTPTPRRTTGLAHHASVAALTTARSLTSHLRRHYHERYKSRYERYRLIFAVDMFLVGFAVALFILVLVLSFRGVQIENAGVDVGIQTALIRAADVTPVDIHLHVTDGQRHDDVSLNWVKPAWVDIVSSTAGVSQSGELFIGTLLPQEDRDVQLKLRVKALPGTTIPFQGTIRQLGWLGIPQFALFSAGHWQVFDSSVHVVEPVDASAIVSGGSFPLVVANDGDVPAPLETLRLTERDGAPDAVINQGDSFLTISNLAPQERRIVYVDLGETSATSVHLKWELQDSAQTVDAGQHAFVVATTTTLFVTKSLTWAKGSDVLNIDVRNGERPARIFVDHPLLRDATTQTPYRLYAVQPHGQSVSVDLDLTRQTSSTHWSVVPVEDGVNGVTLGQRAIGSVSASVPFSVEARYYTSTGDQVGIGPLPPQVGQTTSYWIVWTVGPTDSDLTNVVIQAALPPHVQATGKFASAVGGAMTSSGSIVTWNLPVLPATHGEAVTFAFEVALDPIASMRGSAADLLLPSSLTATDVQTNESVSGAAGRVTTDLQKDPKASGNGVVR